MLPNVRTIGNFLFGVTVLNKYSKENAPTQNCLPTMDSAKPSDTRRTQDFIMVRGDTLPIISLCYLLFPGRATSVVLLI